MTFNTGSQFCKRHMTTACHRHISTLQATHDAVDSGEEVLLHYGLMVVTRCDECRLVTYIGDVGTREAWRLLGEELAVELSIELQLFEVYLEYLLALLDIGQAHLNLAVEATSAHECLIQDVYAVGCRQHDDTSIGLEAIHLREQLVERILSLVVTREARVLASRTADGVNLVDEDDAWCHLLSLLEEVTDTRSTHTYEHLHKVRARNREEGDVGLTRHSLR